ncbi:Het-C-domain-containing protein [Durotheca rogersii]|uniref:Het-C-domain-containing protein n=1 Tax=Durotheca rogersii TaxID=419775 RepID=UPI00221F099D|nr:Het-C-domain-containing protein [Durotheca rogersii]KAI5864905.1 Het-C-domain-containing protein [Durotheca rogersii]
MAVLKPLPALWGLLFLWAFASPALAFGAGNIAGISKIEGQNWRHGDIEDTLLSILMARAVGGKKFDKLMVSRVYFGNWLRDYSQAIDVGTVKNVSAEAIRLLLCILGFLSFGYGSKEFEVTADRLGCYRPEDHIDNPKNYADNEDARQYYEKLRGPVDEAVELAIDPETGLKNYIANERAGIMNSALHVRNLFGRCIELGRSYKQNNRKADLHEALRLLGTGLHCLEDFFAHSNYTELALIELGERDVFPHVGRNTQIEIPGARGSVYPCVTGTFGGVDFLHSVTGEVSDKLTQSEIQELEGTLEQNSKNDTSILEGLLDKIPDGIFGGDKKQKLEEIQSNATNSQLQNTSISPREPEEFTQYIQQVFGQIMPAIEFHDEIMKGLSKAIDQLPVLPQIIEQLEEQLSMWVFAIMAPFVVPIIQQIKNELRTGSSEIIDSSKNEQHVVFEDDDCTDPTHSMLSKDHFTNILNEVAGKTASKVVGWVVPQIMEAWDDDGIDIDRTMSRIVNGILHHPAQRDQGEDGARDGRQIIFRSVEEWWDQIDEGAKDEYRRKLSREGVENGENHREGVHDSGHGCGKPLGMHKNFAKGGTMEDRIASAAAGAIVGGVTSGIADFVKTQSGGQINLPTIGGREESSSSGGGGLLGAISSSLLGGAFKSDETESYRSRSQADDGSYSESQTEYGRSGDRHGQAEYSERQYPGGGESREYSGYVQQDSGRSYGYQERTEIRPTYGGGYEERTERRYESNTDSYEESSGRDRRRGSDDDDDDSSSRRRGSHERHRDHDSGREEHRRRYDEERSSSSHSGDRHGRRYESSHGSGSNERDEGSGYGRSGGYGRDESSAYGRPGGYYREESSGYGRSDNYDRDESSGYGRSGGYDRDEGYVYRDGDERRADGSRYGF